MMLGENQPKKNRDQNNAKIKRDILLKAQGFMERHELPKDPKAMDKEGFYNYFLRLFAETYTNYPSYMTAEERIAMSKIDVTPLKELEAQYKRLVTPFDPVTMDVPDNTNYDFILSEKEAELHIAQVEALSALEKLLEATKGKLNINYLRPLIQDLKNRTALRWYLSRTSI